MFLSIMIFPGCGRKVLFLKKKKKNTAALVFCFLRLVGGFMIRSPRYYQATPSLGLIKVVSKAISCCYYAFFYLYPSVNWLGGVFALQLFLVLEPNWRFIIFFFFPSSYCWFHCSWLIIFSFRFGRWFISLFTFFTLSLSLTARSLVEWN